MVYDLQSNGQLTWEFTWDQTNEIDSAPIPDGIRRVRATTAGTLEIIDRNFVSHEQRIISVLHGIAAKNFLRLKLINKGQQLLVQHRWSLWPWRLLATQGQLPLDALFLCCHSSKEIMHTTADDIIFAIWDVETAKKMTQVFVSPPIAQGIVITEDGKKMVIPEAMKRSDTSFWVKPVDTTTSITKPTYQYLPAEPRGVRVVDLATAQTIILDHSITEAIQRMNSAGYSVMFDRHHVMVSYVEAIPNDYDGYAAFKMHSTSPNDEFYPRYDLYTGKQSIHQMPNCEVLAPPGWGVQIDDENARWPAVIQYVGERFGYNLDVIYPRSRYLSVRFIDTDQNQLRFRYQLKTGDQERFQSSYSADRQAIVFWRQLAEGVQVILWQIPFEVYSPWWSLGVGLFFFALPLAWRVWRYTTNLRLYANDHANSSRPTHAP
ncbi:MAG TPA: hypothetical protein PLN21_13750 [Gemmatales bacterium]|nr:hypothetical protein [Gemmatales bacterium]